MVMANSKCGGIPLGVIITEGLTLEEITDGFQLFKSMLTEEAFGGRGQRGPQVIMTDNSDTERQSLHTVFPGHKCFYKTNVKNNDNSKNKVCFCGLPCFLLIFFL